MRVLTGPGEHIPGASLFWGNTGAGLSSKKDMGGFLALGGLFLAGFAFVSLMLAFVLIAVKSVFWLVLLPLRLLFWAIGAVVMLVGSAIGLVLALTVGLALILAPLLPLLLVGALVYGLVKMVKSPVTA